VIAIGMGTPVADMMLREVRAITEGPLLVVRFGSCGGIGPETIPGQVNLFLKVRYQYVKKVLCLLQRILIIGAIDMCFKRIRHPKTL
jgi:hypothetical protein